MPPLDQPIFKFFIIFNDAVMAHPDIFFTIAMRMSIFLRWLAVSRPTGVGNANNTVNPAARGYFFLKQINTAHRLNGNYFTPTINSNASGIISPVFKPF